MKSYEKWLAVVNPSSANGRTGRYWPGYWEEIRQAGIDLEFCLTTGPGNGTEITKQAVGQGYRKFIAVGGDGTVNEVVNGLVQNDKMAHEDIELAVFALGTGSDFVRTCRASTDITGFIHTIKNNTKGRLDLGKVSYLNWQGQPESRYFANASNVGFGAEVVHEANARSKVLGSKLTYFARMLTTLARYNNIEVELIIDKEREISGKFCGLMICNGQYIGGGMKIAPAASLRDGFFDLVLIKDISFVRLLSRFPLIYWGKHVHLPEVELFRCRSVTIKTPDQALLEIDGEIPGVAPSVYSILPDCLTMRG